MRDAWLSFTSAKPKSARVRSRARATKWIGRVEDGSKEQQAAQGHGQARQHALDRQGRSEQESKQRGRKWGAERLVGAESVSMPLVAVKCDRGGLENSPAHSAQTEKQGWALSCSYQMIGYRRSSQPKGRPRVLQYPARGPTCDAQPLAPNSTSHSRTSPFRLFGPIHPGQLSYSAPA